MWYSPLKDIKLLLLVWMLLSISQISGKKVGCGNDYDMSLWSCEEVDYYFSYKQIENTLYCIGYDKTVSPNDVLGIQDPLSIKYLHTFTEMVKVDDAKRLLTVKDFFWAQVYDYRLWFNCSNINFEPMTKYFVKELAFSFWFPIPSSNVTASIKYDVSAGMWSYPITQISIVSINFFSDNHNSNRSFKFLIF